MPKVISCVNQKGGVGKSAATVHLSAYLSEFKNLKVCIIDFDTTQGNTTKHLVGPLIQDGEYKEGICAVIDERAKIDDVILKTERENLWVVPSEIYYSNGNVVDVADILKKMEFNQGYTFLRDAIIQSKKLQEMDAIFIDLGPKTDIVSASALCASDYALIPTRSESEAIDAIEPTVIFINKIQNHLNEHLKCLGVFVSLEDKRVKKNLTRTNEELEEITEKLKIPLFDSRISTNSNFAYLCRDRKLIFDIKGNRGSAEYQSLGDEIIEKMVQFSTPAPELMTTPQVTSNENTVQGAI